MSSSLAQSHHNAAKTSKTTEVVDPNHTKATASSQKPVPIGPRRQAKLQARWFEFATNGTKNGRRLAIHSLGSSSSQVALHSVLHRKGLLLDQSALHESLTAMLKQHLFGSLSPCGDHRVGSLKPSLFSLALADVPWFGHCHRDGMCARGGKAGKAEDSAPHSLRAQPRRLVTKCLRINNQGSNWHGWTWTSATNALSRAWGRHSKLT
jgi:hypothetical protein